MMRVRRWCWGTRTHRFKVLLGLQQVGILALRLLEPCLLLLQDRDQRVDAHTSAQARRAGSTSAHLRRPCASMRDGSRTRWLGSSAQARPPARAPGGSGGTWRDAASGPQPPPWHPAAVARPANPQSPRRIGCGVRASPPSLFNSNHVRARAWPCSPTASPALTRASARATPSTRDALAGVRHGAPGARDPGGCTEQGETEEGETMRA